MAKRFTDTEKWRDPWFCSLSSSDKLFWVYLLDTCNVAGIWQVNWPLVHFYIPGFEFQSVTFQDRIQVLSNQKWFVPKFIVFQYGTLQKNNRLHQRILFELEKEGVSIPLGHPSQGDKDKDMDKDKDREMLFELLWSKYPRKDGRKEAFRHFKATVTTEEDSANIQAALGNYLKHLKNNRTEPQFIKMGSTWFNNWQDWVSYKDPREVLGTSPIDPEKARKIEEEHHRKQQEFADREWAKRHGKAEATR